MKFAFFLLCVLVVIQGFQADSVKENVDRSLSDVWEGIKSAGGKIKRMFGDIGYYIPRKIESLQNKAEHTKYLIQHLKDSRKQKYQVAFTVIGDISKQCLNKKQKQLSILSDLAETKLNNCTAELKIQRDSLRLMLDNLTAQTKQTKQLISESIKVCFSQHTWWKTNPLYHCVSDRLDDTLLSLRKTVSRTLLLAKNVAKAATVDLTKCVAKAQRELYDKEKEVFGSLKECGKNGGTTEEPPRYYPGFESNWTVEPPR